MTDNFSYIQLKKASLELMSVQGKSLDSGKMKILIDSDSIRSAIFSSSRAASFPFEY